VALGTVACSSSQPVVGSPSPSQTADVDAPAGETVTGNTAVTLGVPPGHLPRPGHCRIWVPGTPPGHQAKARSCDGILAHAPAGSMVIYRPYKDKKIVRVRYVDRERVGVITIARVFEVGSGRLVREERQ
jgi:hypothetical protein